MQERVENLKRAAKKELTNRDKKNKTRRWEKPTLEDVSEKIMAQPYIRFT